MEQSLGSSGWGEGCSKLFLLADEYNPWGDIERGGIKGKILALLKTLTGTLPFLRP